MSVLDKMLQSLGVTEFSQLTKEEIKQYKEWQKALEKKELTVEEMGKFIDSQIATLNNEIVKPGLSKDQDTFIKCQLRCFTVLKALFTIQTSKAQWVEDYIKQTYNIN